MYFMLQIIGDHISTHYYRVGPRITIISDASITLTIFQKLSSVPSMG